MKLVGLSFLLAVFLVCGYIATVMTLGGFFTGRLYGEPMVSIKDRPGLFLAHWLRWVFMAVVFVAGAVVVATELYESR